MDTTDLGICNGTSVGPCAGPQRGEEAFVPPLAPDVGARIDAEIAAWGKPAATDKQIAAVLLAVLGLNLGDRFDPEP